MKQKEQDKIKECNQKFLENKTNIRDFVLTLFEYFGKYIKNISLNLENKTSEVQDLNEIYQKLNSHFLRIFEEKDLDQSMLKTVSSIGDY